MMEYDDDDSDDDDDDEDYDEDYDDDDDDDDDSYMITFFLQDRSITKRSLPTNSLNRFNLLKSRGEVVIKMMIKMMMMMMMIRKKKVKITMIFRSR